MKSEFIKLCCCFLIILILDYIGVLKHYFEVDFAHFAYKKNAFGLNAEQYFVFNNTLLIEDIKSNPPLLLFLVKSAVKNAKQRHVIRRTWGSNIESTRCIFLIGTSRHMDEQQMINRESMKYKDIIQMNFLDTYYNNTIKTLTGMRWASELQNRVPYFMFVDDDYYVSIKNVFKCIKDCMKKHSVFDMFVGFVMQTSPHRHKFSKWYVSLEEYPFDRWPPYVTAGAYILSNVTLNSLYKTSLDVPYFRFDDIYMGILALKANITLTHNEQFHFNRPASFWRNNCESVIASHGFNNHLELEKVWKLCNAM